MGEEGVLEGDFAGELDLRDPTQEELDAVVEVDLTDSVAHLSDGDNGYQHIWPLKLEYK